MTQGFYVGDYGGPLETEVFGDDGFTPITPLSATVDILNRATGLAVVTGGLCGTDVGRAFFAIPNASPATATAGRFIAYLAVVLETGNKRTIAIPYNVYDKTSTQIVERWQRKVEDSAPTPDHMTDEKGRDWIDDAVDYLNNEFDTGYTSVLASLDPVPTASDSEFISGVASLMARTAWWAGKGSWRDGEISFDQTPFSREWESLHEAIATISNTEMFDIGGDLYNRDHVYFRGTKYTNIDYWDASDTIPLP